MSTTRLLSKIRDPLQLSHDHQTADDDIYLALAHFEEAKDAIEEKTDNNNCPYPLNTALIALHLAAAAFRKGHAEAKFLTQIIKDFINSNWEPMGKVYVRVHRSKVTSASTATIEPFILFPDFYQSKGSVSSYNRFLFSSNTNNNELCESKVEIPGLKSMGVKG